MGNRSGSSKKIRAKNLHRTAWRKLKKRNCQTSSRRYTKFTNRRRPWRNCKFDRQVFRVWFINSRQRCNICSNCKVRKSNKIYKDEEWQLCSDILIRSKRNWNFAERYGSKSIRSSSYTQNNIIQLFYHPNIFIST